jgi:beta-glucosidase
MILQIFIRGNPFRGSAGLTTQNKETYLKLIQNQSLQAVIIYGSPYVAQWFKSELPRDIPFIFSYGQNDLAQAMACEKLFAQVNPSESYKNDFTD